VSLSDDTFHLDADTAVVSAGDEYGRGHDRWRGCGKQFLTGFGHPAIDESAIQI